MKQFAVFIGISSQAQCIKGKRVVVNSIVIDSPQKSRLDFYYGLRSAQNP